MTRLGVLSVVVIALSLAGVVWWLNSASLTATQLCQVLYVRIEAADLALGAPRSSSFDYFRDHPKALKAAHRENRDVLDSLPCTP